MGFCSRLGERPAQYLETFRAGADPGIILNVLVDQSVGRLGGDGFWDGDYGWGVRVRRPQAFGARRWSRRPPGALGIVTAAGYHDDHDDHHDDGLREQSRPG